MTGKLVIFSAPSGSGKTTIVRELLARFSCFEFSVSATSRPPRGTERDGVDYFFLTPAEFTARAERGDFVEWEEVYGGTCYGTLKTELERIWARGHVILFDVDVVGGLSLKRIFGDDALALFVMPPSLKALRDRLINRGTDAPEKIETRLAKAEAEMARSTEFDHIVLNDDLEEAVADTEALINDFLK